MMPIGLAYLQHQENMRANRAKEALTADSNRIQEEKADKDRTSRENISTLDRTSKEGIADKDRSSRESIASLDRLSREGISEADRSQRDTIARDTYIADLYKGVGLGGTALRQMDPKLYTTAKDANQLINRSQELFDMDHTLTGMAMTSIAKNQGNYVDTALKGFLNFGGTGLNYLKTTKGEIN